MGRESFPILAAIKAQAIVVSRTASGSEAPAKGIAGDRAVATAAAGAIAVIDWNNTSDMPIAFFLSVIPPASLVAVFSAVVSVVSDMRLSPLLCEFPTQLVPVTINQKYHSETAVALALAAVSTVSVLSGVIVVVCRGRHVKSRVAVKEAHRF